MITSYFWAPFIWWTSLVSLILLIHSNRFKLSPFFNYYFHVALAVSFPVALLLNGLPNLLGKIFTSLNINAVSDFYLVSITIPELVVNSSQAMVNKSLPLNLYGIITLTTILLSGIGIFRIIKLLTEYISLRKINRQFRLKKLAEHPLINNQNFKLVSANTSQILLATTNTETPFTYGWKTPIIVIPEYLQKESTVFNLIVLHELVHIKRHDYQLNLVLSLISAVLGFNPLVKYLIHQINEFRETSCDQEVITEFHAPPKKYAELIFSVSQSSGHFSNLQIALNEQNSNLKKRIKTMNTYIPKTSKKLNSTIIALIASIIVLTIACTESATISNLGIDEKKVSEQQTQLKNIPIDDIYELVDKMPEPNGGLIDIMKKVTYPEEAKKSGIQGRVTVQFIVDKNGIVQNPKVLKGIGSGCDEEAIRVIENTKFTPGEQNGKKVAVKMTFPIVFRLQ